MITWAPSIIVTNLAEDRVSFSAVRLDSETGDTKTYSAGEGIVTTNAHKRAMEDAVWAKYQEALADEIAAAAKINTWLGEAKTNLENKEP